MADQVVGNGALVVKPKMSDDFESELAAKGKAGGSKFGNALSVAAGNLLSQGIQKAAQVAADVFVEGFNTYANFEQLAGGVEKIFDNANQSQIFADADRAYKDLNLSANQYLETINQVGASFAANMGDQAGYDTARQGMLAISDYASGTGRSIDELNQKYALITRSTSSYQSIADQFSGILPATSEGFLKSAQAAGFLGGEYTKLTEVPIAEYQQAVTQMLTQGVEELGLAGNTAAETAGTITGSIAGLQSAWSNFLGALFQENAELGPYVDALGEMLLAAFNNIGQAVANFAANTIGALGTWLKEQLLAVGIDVDGLLASITTSFDLALGEGGIAGFVNTAKENVLNAVQPVVDFVTTNVMPLAGQVYSIMAPILATIQGTVVRIFGKILSVISSVAQGIMAAIQFAWPFIEGVILAVTTAIGAFIEEVWPAIASTIEAAVQTIQAIIDVVFPVVGAIIDTVFTGVKAVADEVWPVVSGVVQGAAEAISGAIEGLQPILHTVTDIFNGIKSAIEDPINAAKDAVQGAIDKITGIFDGAHFELPHFDLPHFNIDGGEVPWGIAGKGYPPSISIDWYAKGGVIDGATLIGVGEAGPEMILPREGDLMDDFAGRIANRFDGALIAWLDNNLGPTIANYTPTLTRREFDRLARGALA